MDLLTGVFGNAPTNPVLFGFAFAGMAIGYGVRHLIGVFKKKNK
jgi:hypothetical protein